MPAHHRSVARRLTSIHIHPIVLGLLFAMGSVSLSACIKKKDASVKNFESLGDPSVEKVRPDETIEGFRVVGLDALGLKYTVKRTGVRAAKGSKVAPTDANAAFFTEITIAGTLTDEQHAALEKRYGGTGNVPFAGNEAKADWTLVDFLPPAVQALNGLRFKTTTLPHPAIFPADYFTKQDVDDDVDVSMNCHATAYEVARSLFAPVGSKPSVTLFFLGDVSSFDFVDPRTDPAGNVAPDSALAPVAAITARNKGRKLGDMIQFYAPQLLHSAIWVDEDLFFEKTDTDSAAPYRLVTYADMVGVVGLAAPLKSGRLMVAFNRFIPTKLVPPVSFFAGNASHPSAERDPKDSSKFTGSWSKPITFAEEGIASPEAMNYFIGLFSNQGGRNVADPAYIKEFALEPDKSTGRAQLPQAAFEAGSFVPR